MESLLTELALNLGKVAFILLVTIVLVFAYLALRMLLEFGRVGFKEVGAAAVGMYKLLRYEPRKTHPAIRMEFRFHQFFGMVAIVSLLLLVLHSLIPWASKTLEYAASVGFVSSLVFIVVLGHKSIELSVRLP